MQHKVIAKTELEKVLTQASKKEMIDFLLAHPAYFEEAMGLALSDKQPFSWRAAWLLSDCIVPNDARVTSYLPLIVAILPTAKDAQFRELIKVLLEMRVPEELEGVLFSLCVEKWKDLSMAPAVRYNAFRMMLAIRNKYPELHHEIELLSSAEYLDSLSRGVKHSVQKMLQGIIST